MPLFFNSSKAANVTISSATNISTNNLFSGLSNGDTIFINAALTIDADFSLANFQNLVIRVQDGGSLTWGANQNTTFTLDSSVTLSFTGTGTLSVAGGCQANKRIALNSVDYTTCNGTPSFEDIVADGGIAPGGVPLPVTLGFFNGFYSENLITLNWKTFMEYNSSHYEIEQLSNQEWSQIGNILSQNEINGSEYEFEISVAEKKFDLFFRLKMVDFDGSYEYSPVVKVSPTFSNAVDWVIFPNPVNDLMNIQVNDNIQFVEILDVVGNILISETTSTLNLRNLSQGVYFVRIRIESGQLLTQKILKN